MGGGVELPARKNTVQVPKENWLVRWWKKIIYEEYHLTIWFVAAKEVDAEGNTSYRRVAKSYKAIKVKKITPIKE